MKGQQKNTLAEKRRQVSHSGVPWIKKMNRNIDNTLRYLKDNPEEREKYEPRIENYLEKQKEKYEREKEALLKRREEKLDAQFLKEKER